MLRGRTILITGGGAGIGRATAALCGQHGASVAVLDRDRRHAEEAAEEARERGAPGALPVECDVADERSVEEAFDAVARGLGQFDGLVTSAGIDAGGFAHELPVEIWERVIGTNLRGTYLCCKHALRSFLAGGGGTIVCVSSPAAFVGLPGGATAYCASKGGVSALVRTLAVDYARHGVRVNALAPGSTETELMWANVSPAERDRMRGTLRSEIPLGRLAEPEEIARGAIWLLSDESSYVTGSHLVCDGGVLAKASVSV